MPSKKQQRKARGQQLLRNRGILRRPSQGQDTSDVDTTVVSATLSPSTAASSAPQLSMTSNLTSATQSSSRKPVLCDEVPSPRRSRRPVKTLVMKRRLISVDDEQPSTSKGATTLTPVKTFAKKSKLSDVSIDNILNRVANDDDNMGNIAETDSGIVNNIFNRDFEGEDNEADLPAVEENLEESMLSPSGLRNEMMEYNPEFVEDQDDKTFISTKNQMNDALMGSTCICSKCESSNLEFKLLYPRNKQSFVNGMSFSCSRCKANSSVIPCSERVKLPMVGKSKQNWAYKSNIKFALGILNTGMTYQEGSEFLRHMGITPPSHNAYLKAHDLLIRLKQKKT